MNILLLNSISDGGAIIKIKLLASNLRLLDIAGVWLFHCHFEIHTSWGMETVFYVREGTGINQTLEAPPSDYPACIGTDDTTSSSTVSLAVIEVDSNQPEINLEVPH